MARLQVMPLPVDDGKTPFLLVLDDLTSDQVDGLSDLDFKAASESAGARCILAFPFKVEVF